MTLLFSRMLSMGPILFSYLFQRAMERVCVDSLTCMVLAVDTASLRL